MRSCSRSAAGVCATVRAGLIAFTAGAEVWNRLISPQPASARAAHSKAGAAHRRRLIRISRRPALSATSATRISARELIPAKQLNLPRPEHLDARAATRLDPAADTNPSIFERLGHNPGRREGRRHAP